MEKLEFLSTVDKNIKWYSHYGKKHDCSSEKLHMELSHDVAIPFLGILGIDPKELNAGIQIFVVPMFVVAVFTVLG